MDNLQKYMLQLQIVVIFFTSKFSYAKYVSGHAFSDKTWMFVARFAFFDTGGKLKFDVEYPVSEYCCPKLAYYYDDYWLSVYPHDEMDCDAKLKYAGVSSGANLSLDLSHSIPGISQCEKSNSTHKRRCVGTIHFKSVKNRWWFFVLSQCNSNTGLDVKYILELTNGDSWEKHLSADEMHILESNVAFFCCAVILTALASKFAHELWKQDFLHRTVKFFISALFYETFAIMLQTAYYIEMVTSGKEYKFLRTAGDLLHAASEVLFVFLLLLISKGYTVTRGRLPNSVQCQFIVFFTLYMITYGIMFIYDVELFDPAIVRYLYDSPAGQGMVALRLVAWIWFASNIYFTVKPFPEKKQFYMHLFLFFVAWFFAKPIIVFLGYYVIEPWSRTVTVNAVDLSICILGFGGFLWLIRPSQALRNFPFHVRTAQVDAIAESNNPNFQHTEDFGRLSREETGKLETSLNDLKSIPSRSSIKELDSVS